MSSTDPLNINAHYSKEGYSAITIDNYEHVDRLESVGVGGYRPMTLRSRRERLVKRSNGRSLVSVVGLKSRGFGYVTDWFTTLVDAKWWIIASFFGSAYILSWLVFGCVWAIVVEVDSGSNDTCLVNVNTFSGAFLFSVELQVTIGFGNKYVASDCHFGIFLLTVQCVLGLILDAVLLGLVFAKITRPRNRRKSIAFSKIAVIYEKGGQRVLELRVGDIRRSQLVECHVRLQLYWNKLVDEGSGEYEFQQFDLDVGYDTGWDRLFLLTPVSVCHTITEDSPLHGLTPSQLDTTDLELVVVLEGIVEATGLTAQALWSYTRDEILFDREFVPVVSRHKGKWEVDFSKLDQTRSIHKPSQSIDVQCDHV